MKCALSRAIKGGGAVRGSQAVAGIMGLGTSLEDSLPAFCRAERRQDLPSSIMSVEAGEISHSFLQ